jgi:hypothetical protein
MRVPVSPALAAKLAAKLRRIEKLSIECLDLAVASPIATDWPALDRILSDAREQVASLTEHTAADIQ